ncbi:MAG: 50S ribosomal protein L3 [Halobacteriovoraceae bacterium]|nr:50S ribosomal protein L3 [Halobacteriovoraceae bacterium]|tara:strand:- start:7011 stop:7670 length:660 start_codon:yes stop_codon:yes gene_type:complete
MSEENKVSLPVFYGQKAGMTRIFDEAGKHVPVTVVKLIPNVISQVKTADKDGYEAYQLAYGIKREKTLTKPTIGQLKKAGVESMQSKFSEVKTAGVDAGNLGKELSLEDFQAKTIVDVTGTSKGKGFAGVMKRWNFGGAMASHGHKKPRSGGSIGMCASPSRVHKEKKMPGHMGVETKTIQNLEVVELNTDQGYMLIKGSIPGAKNGFIRVSKALKGQR